MHNFAIESLERSGRTILQIYGSLGAEQLLWKSAPQTWSLLEILHHLYDEEREDFRQRLRLTLEDPTEDWPPIDPQGWVQSRNYQARPLDDLLQGFSDERTLSLDWLRSLESPDWERTRTHPAFGSMKAGDLLSSWVAHDLLHLRQITATQFRYATKTCQPYSNGYAGNW